MNNCPSSVKRVVSNPDEMGRDHAKVSKTAGSSLPNDQDNCIAMGSISITESGHDVNIEAGTNLIANDEGAISSAGDRNISTNGKGVELKSVGMESDSSSQQTERVPTSHPSPNAKTSTDAFDQDEVNEKGKIRRQVSSDGKTMRGKSDSKSISLVPGSRNSSGSSGDSNPGNWGWFDEVHFDDKGKGSPRKESDNLKTRRQSSEDENKAKDEYSITLRKEKGAFTQTRIQIINLII